VTRSANTIHSLICLEDAKASFIDLLMLWFKGVSIPEGLLSSSGW
jgi:hypothetical protein